MFLSAGIWLLGLYILGDIRINFSKKTYNVTKFDETVKILLHLNKPSCMDIMGEIEIWNGKCILMCVYIIKYESA